MRTVRSLRSFFATHDDADGFDLGVGPWTGAGVSELSREVSVNLSGLSGSASVN